jgi:NAD dependent epimerase/dehydratase family enzyme
MNPVIVIFGASGFTGRYLCRHFARQGWEVVAVSRSRAGWGGDGMFLEWDGRSPGPWMLALEGAQAVIHGDAGMVGGGDGAHDATRAIARAIAACKSPPATWVFASSAGWYRHADDRPQDDWLGEPGDDPCAMAARAAEEVFFSQAAPARTRKVSIRSGMVLAHEPGGGCDALRGWSDCAGGAASAEHRISWIHMEDFLRGVGFIIGDPFLDGAVNLSAPESPCLGEWIGMPRSTAALPAAPPAKSQWVLPLRMRDAGFRWRWPHAADALANLASRPGLDGFFLPHPAPLPRPRSSMPPALVPASPSC